MSDTWFASAVDAVLPNEDRLPCELEGVSILGAWLEMLDDTDP